MQILNDSYLISSLFLANQENERGTEAERTCILIKVF